LIDSIIGESQNIVSKMGAEKENSGASAPNDNDKEHQWLVGRISIGCFITFSSAFNNKAFLS
jgi:hypothetical protein